MSRKKKNEVTLRREPKLTWMFDGIAELEHGIQGCRTHREDKHNKEQRTEGFRAENYIQIAAEFRSL